jgi:predicted nucleic acid-binding protein
MSVLLSVWISALISQNGMAREIIRFALMDKISPQLSTALFLEYEDVMKRDKIMVAKANRARGLELLDKEFKKGK